MFYGVGGFLSGFIAIMVSKKLSQNKSIIVFYLLAIGILIGILFNKYVIILYIISCLLGITNSSIRILLNTLIMDIVPKKVMGRSMSIWVSISLILQAISSSLIGVLIDKYSSRIGFLYMSGLMFLGYILTRYVLVKIPEFNMRRKDNE